MNTRQKVLEDALKCVNGEREKQYGNPEDNFKRIADRWSLYLTDLYKDEGVVIELEPIDVARMMIDFKLARANGPKDKLDNYVDMIGYAACAAEIFEKNADCESKTAESRSCSKKASDNIRDFFERVTPGEEYCNRNDCGQFDACMTAYQHYIYNKTKEASEAIDKCMCEQVNKDPYSYFHDKLANYVSVKAKEAHVPLGYLNTVNIKFPRELSDYLDQASTDCVINGKKLIDCYKEIDELFAKYVKSSTYRIKKKPDKDVEKRLYDDIRALYGLDDSVRITIVKSDSLNRSVIVTDEGKNEVKDTSFDDTYKNVSNYINSSSIRMGVNVLDVVDHLTRNGHAPTEMAALLMAGKLGFDEFFAFVDDAIKEVKKKGRVESGN